LTKQDFETKSKSLKAYDQKTRRLEDLTSTLKGENERLKKMVLDLDNDCEAKGFQIFNLTEENKHLTLEVS
jgi:hypothetical protein